MSDKSKVKTFDAHPTVDRLDSLAAGELEDLCDATDAAIEAGGGFGWVNLPPRDTLERYWQGVVTMPGRILLAARMDGVICGTCQLVKPPYNNEAQSHIVQLSTHFIAPWARGHGLAEKLIRFAEETALKEGFAAINLDVRETLTEAIALYEKLGFTRIGTHPCYARVDNKILKGYYYYKIIDEKLTQQQP